MATSESTQRQRWLVASWPGMGNVALLAVGHMLEQLQVRKVAELNPREFFEVQSLDIHRGLATPGRLPRGMFFEWDDPRERHDLTFFVGEAQPARGGFKLCEQVATYAAQHGVTRLYTFAAMATQLQLGEQPKVFAAATDLPLLNEVRELGAHVLDEGQISGLNGVLLAAGAEHGIGGTCLLGEMPYFAAAVPNPRAAHVALACFAQLAGIDVDLAPLAEQADAVDAKLGELLEQLKAATHAAESDEQEQDDTATAADEPDTQARPPLDPQTQRRIEALFDKAHQDRSKAFELKHELDRLGVFKQYEDRFLDLFRKAE